MKSISPGKLSRRSFVTTAAASVAAISAIGGIAPADAQLVATTSNWNPSSFNALAKKPAHIKQVYDIISIGGGGFLNNIKNSLNGLHFGFGIPADQIQVVAALHGPSNMLNMDDYVWKKYKVGEWFKVTDPETGQPAERNIFYPSKHNLKYPSSSPDSEDSLYQDTSIQALQHRDVKFLSCHTAAEEQARKLIKLRGLTQKPEEVVDDWLSHALPGVMVVAAMVAAIALLQTEGRYSYITVA
jgi:intracellular sulfur oxidation DsrE/DsrF family protein